MGQKGPGLGNLQYTDAELFKSIWVYKDETHFGSNTSSMINGYLVTTFTPDGGVGPGGILVLDVSNPRSPVIVKRVYDERTASLRECHAIGNYGNYIVIQDGCGIQIWDMADARNPILVKKFCMEGYDFGPYGGAWQVFWQAPYIYVGAGSGLDVIDATNVANPVHVKHVNIGMQVGPLYAVGNLLMTSAMDAGRGFGLLDISNPRDPKLLNAATGAENIYAAYINGNRIITSARGNSVNSTFSVYDVSDPLNITLAGALDIKNSGEQLYNSTQDRFIFQGCQTEVVKIDATDISNLKVVGRGSLDIDLGSSDHGQVTPLGNLIFVGNDHGNGSGLLVHQKGPDTKGPEPNMISPSPNSRNRALTSRIGITFTDNVDIYTLSKESFIVRPKGGPALAGKYSYQNMIVNFCPDQPLQANTVYEVFIPKGGIKDWSGNAIESDFISYFSTGTAGDFAPSKPSNFTLVESTDKIRLSWDAISGANKAVIRRSNSIDGAYTVIGETSNTTFDDAIAPGISYYYTITGENQFGQGEKSSVLKGQADNYVYLTDLVIKTDNNGWGPAEIDQSNGDKPRNDGKPIQLNEQSYTRGLGMHAPGQVVYDLNGQYKRFTSDIGVSEDVGLAGSIFFKVLVDGKEVYNSGLMYGGSLTQTIDIDVSNAMELTLVLTEHYDNANDHGSWGGAKLVPVRTVTNMADYSHFNQISVTPNPAVDKVEITSEIEVKELALKDIYGRVVSKDNEPFVGKKTINLQGMLKGVYLISIKSEGKVDVGKVVIQ
jgi:hypothetical protein